MPAPEKISKPDILLWAAALTISIFLATRGWAFVFWNDGVHPVTNDSFYHMTRIEAIADDPTSIHEFDALLHWPDGMWVVWPWAYDYLLGLAASMLPENMRAAAAMFTPLLLLAVNLLLFAGIARAVLTPRMAAVGLLAYAAAPVTKSLHKLGYVDHHAAEHTLWLLSLYLLIRWRRQPASSGRAAMLGAVLGTACAVHNGLFILQLPVLAALLLTRLLGRTVPDVQALKAFGAALLLAQLAVLLPSHHFADFGYEFFYLSWFHLHVAALTCLAVFAISRPDRRQMWAWLAIGLVLALPAARQVLHGVEFMGARLPGLEEILEANSPYWGQLPFPRMTSHFSALIWLLPVFAAWAVHRLLRSRWLDVEPVVLVYGLFGALMLAAQIRFQQYGLLSLVLLPLMTLQSVAGRPRDAVYAGLLMAGAYLASPGLFSYQYPVGGSLRYAHGYQLIELLGTACADRPGLLLADHNWGNFLRYRTRCPLLANNFIMTPEDLAAMEESRRLLSLEPAALSAENPDLRYVLVSAMDQHHLGTRLLSGESFEGFRLIGEIHGMGGRAIGRAYEVLPGLAPGHAGDTPGK